MTAKRAECQCMPTHYRGSDPPLSGAPSRFFRLMAWVTFSNCGGISDKEGAKSEYLFPREMVAARNSPTRGDAAASGGGPSPMRGGHAVQHRFTHRAFYKALTAAQPL